MNRIAFLACAETLPPIGPNPGPRRGDAFEHDLEIAALRPAFEAAGMDLVELDWRAPIDDFDGIDLALLGTAWDYQDHPEAFLTRLDELGLQSARNRPLERGQRLSARTGGPRRPDHSDPLA